MRTVRKKKMSNRRAYWQNQNMKISGVNLAAIIGIIGMAVLCGFITTKFVIYPMILGEEATFNMKLDIKNLIDLDKRSQSDETDEIFTDNNLLQNTQVTTETDLTSHPITAPNQSDNDENEIRTSGYCIQYGCFSSETAAQSLISELQALGLTARMVKQDDKYKVVGQIFETREEAAEAQRAVLEYGAPEYKDVFITYV